MKLRLITISFALIMLSGCTIINQLRLRNSNGHLEALWQDNATQSLLKTEYDGEKPYVFVSINGVDGFKMLVDTGASITVLQDTDKIKALKLERGYDLALSGWGDEQDTPSYQSELDSLTLGNARFEAVNVAFLPVSKTKYYLRPDEAVFDGVLGHDVIKHVSWIFDKQNNQIAIHKDSIAAPELAISMPFDVFFGKLYIESVVDLGEAQIIENELIIDTGSRHYLKLNQLYLTENEFKLPGRSITAADFGLSGRAVHQRITIPKLTLGDLSIEQVKANIIMSDDDDDYWVIGSALMNQYITVIDYPSETLHFVGYPDTKFRTRYNLLGLELRKIISGEFVVRYVFPDIVADSVDIEEGDLITSINGKASDQISLDGWLSLSAQPGQYEICRERETTRCFQIDSKPIAGYSD